MTKPSITVVQLNTQEDPLWATLMEQAPKLKKVIPIFTETNVLQVGEHRRLLVAMLNDQVVGITSLTNKSFWIQNALGVGYVSTHQKYRNMGVATAMVRAMFLHAQLEGKSISNTPYEPDGELYLKPVMTRVAEEYPDVTLHERP